MNFHAIKINHEKLPILSMATCKVVDTAALDFAFDNGCTWITEAEAIDKQVHVRNHSGHLGVLTASRNWNVPAKIEGTIVLVKWMNSWRDVGPLNSAERTFKMNSGMPKNHTVTFIWEK